MRRISRLAAGVLLVLAQPCAGAPAAAETRIALVIGNGEYVELGRLNNPVKDMTLMADALRGLGFEVIARSDADKITMEGAIQEFGARLEQAGPDAVGLFYYAGHGVQVNGTNYMIPLNANIAREPDVEIEGGQARLGAGADGVRPQPDEHPDPGRLPQQPADAAASARASRA